MRVSRTRMMGVAVLQAAFAAGALFADNAEEASESAWTLARLFERSTVFVVPSREVRLGPDKYGREWRFSGEKRGNFTFFDGVKNVHATDDDALAFTLTGNDAALGWGNYGGRQARQDRVRLWPRLTIALEARQSAAAQTTFRLRFWHNGQREGMVRGKQVLEGTDWTPLEFTVAPRLPLRDGFEFAVSGPSGNRIEIRKLRITRQVYAGFFRKEFVLPDSEVWRAVAEIGAQTHFYVNGHEVGSTEKPDFGGEQYHNETVEFADYLRPGAANCVAIYGWRDGWYPYLCAQGSVIMSSGERVRGG